MHYKVLGTVTDNLLGLLEDIKVESMNLWNDLQQQESFKFMPGVHSKARVMHFQNPVLVDRLRTSIFPAEFAHDDMQIWNHQVFVAPPHSGMEMHKDGAVKKSAFNIIIQGTGNDWTRWYSDDLVASFGGQLALAKPTNNTAKRYSRNIGNLPNYPELPYTDQLTGVMLTGTVYLVNTDIYHAFFNNSDEYRIVLQTNFVGHPPIEDLYAKLQRTGLLNVTPV
jgi:hypothetical protein